MNIKDIVNRDIVSLTNCESEPIHLPGSIQPHGFLLGLSKNDFLVRFCSGNISAFIGLTPEQVLGKHISEIVPADQSAEFEKYTHKGVMDAAHPFVFALKDIPYNTTVHPSGDTIILELEPFPDGTLSLPNLYSQTKTFVMSMERSSHLPELCQEIANETRAMTGYDRVMIYKFDADYNGEVVAESKREDLVSFAGQKYPHTDIPAQARELYIRNPLRMIADVQYTPVPLLTIDHNGEQNNQSLDLSLSVLRSVSPIHIEYLKNMGVAATLTISLLQNQKLWGLIACHHNSPKILPHYTRLSALLQGHFLTSQIAVREVAEEFEIGQEVDKSLNEALTLLHDNENFLETAYSSQSLINLANASGFVAYYNGKLYKNGLTPDDAELRSLFQFLAEKHSAKGFSTDRLADLYPAGHDISKYAAGIIYHPMASGSADGIVWLRKEKVETINWAGNPDKAMLHNEEGFRLSPRKSFELWMEVVKDKSTPWRKSELNAASNFSFALEKHINFHIIREQEDKNRILNEELQAANKELSNLNWISTHDLKEPLRKIQIFASKVLDRDNPDLSTQVKDSVERMRFAAEKMQLLIEDILAYSKAGSMEKVFEPTDLNVVLNEVFAELAETIEAKNVIVSVDDLPLLDVIPFQIRQLFINIVSNSIKFTRPDVTPQVQVKTSLVSGKDADHEKAKSDAMYHQIDIVDNGIGFEEEYNERIFNVFQRLHPAHKYPGTGIGLAICKKIAENHNGFIKASSEPGSGSVFSVFLPAQ